MAYSSYEFHTEVFAATNFGTDTTRYFRLPKGMRGRLKEIEVEGTTLFTNVTTSAAVQVGISGQLTAFANLNTIGALAAGAVFSATKDQPSAIVDTEMPMDTLYYVTFKAPTGGTPAGVGSVRLHINVY